MSKKRKAGKERRRDRLSRLPEPIIHHVLSFLETKSAVQTSVLSRLWRCAWKHVPALHFNQYSFKHYSSFHRHVRKVLSRRYPLNLRKVNFVDYEPGSDGRDDSMVIRVIQYALSHDARHLVIYNDNDISPELHRFSDLFGSISNCGLESLELTSFALDSGIGSPGFRMLTRLDLVTCLVVCGEEVFEPFSNFPCLKHLVLADIQGDFLFYQTSPLVEEGIMKIYGLELLSLKLETVRFFRIDIYAPKLKFFSHWDDVELVSYSDLSLPSLDHADIGFHAKTHLAEEDKEGIASLLMNLFQGLHNAKSLKLYKDTTVPVLSMFCGLLEDEPSPFLRLESLILDSVIASVPYKLINYFFKGSSCASPNIQSFRNNGHAYKFSLPTHVLDQL